MDHFWPTLPLIVPKSEGIALWWDIAWWIFQIVVMVFLLVIVAKWAQQMDRKMNANQKESVNDQSQHPPVQG